MKKIASLAVLLLFLVSIISVANAAQANAQNIQAVSAKNVRENVIAVSDCACAAVYEPVCGSDGKTYANKCRAECAGITDYKEGRCAVAARISNIDAQLRAKVAKLSRARQKELLNLTTANMERVLAAVKVKTVNKAEDLRLRVLTKERIELAKNALNAARLRYENAKEGYLAAREKYRVAKDAGDEEAALEHAKEVLLKSAEAIIGHLEKIKSRIEENENMNEEKAQDLIERIDNQISEIEAIKEKIEAATTAEEVREAARELNAKWKQYKYRIRVFAEEVTTALIQGVINQAEVLEKKLDIALTKLEEDGVEVDVDTEIEEFSSLIADAKDAFKQGQEKLEQAREETDTEAVKALVEEAKSLIDEARGYLRAAHDKLREIVTKIREAGQELQIDETATVEVEVESGGDTDV